MWIGPFLAPVYVAINLLSVVPIGQAERVAVFFPLLIQLGILFVVTAIVTGLTQIKMMRHFATTHASRNPNQDRTRALVKKAMKTAALQFLSTSCFQVTGYTCFLPADLPSYLPLMQVFCSLDMWPGHEKCRFSVCLYRTVHSSKYFRL